MNDSKDFQDAESDRSGNSHVTNQPLLFPEHPIPEELGVLLNSQLQMDIMCAVERYTLAKVTADLDRHRVQQRLVEQTTETLVIPFVEKIVEMLVHQTREKTQQAANTDVQHVVNTVEVETPKIVNEAVRGKKVIREKINHVTEHIRNPQIPYMEKVDEMPVVVQRQIPMVQTVQKTNEIPQLWCIDEVVGNPVVQVSRVQVMEKTVEIPQLQTVEKIAETPQTQTIQCTQAPESLGITPVCQAAQTGHVEELVEVSKVLSQDTVQQRFGKQTIKIPAESASPIFVTAPILEIHPLMSRSSWCSHPRSRAQMPP